MKNRIALPDLAPRLADEGIKASYRGLYLLFLDGQMPGAKRRSNGRISVDADALPAIAAVYAERHPAAVAA